MTYKFKVTPKLQILSVITICLDVFFLPWVVMLVWNNVVIDVVNVRNITYIQSLGLKFGYSALTSDCFSKIMAYKIETMFDDCANMVSTRLFEVANEIKKRFPASSFA